MSDTYDCSICFDGICFRMGKELPGEKLRERITKNSSYLGDKKFRLALFKETTETLHWLILHNRTIADLATLLDQWEANNYEACQCFLCRHKLTRQVPT